VKKIRLTIYALLCLCINAFSQLYMTKSGTVTIRSETFLESIHAVHKQVYAVIETAHKNIAFSLLVKGFEFDRKLMQEHFNESYAETDKYPRSTFNGTYTEDVPLSTNGSYPVTIKGNLVLHGVTKNIVVPAILVVKDGKLSGTATFKLNPEDYNISIPFIVRQKIAKETSIEVQIDCDPK
jgi:hypothetical protein